MGDSLSLVYFPAAVLLGALHALEPGHAKALTGSNGLKVDSFHRNTGAMVERWTPEFEGQFCRIVA